jgi:hypothetical protein
MRDENTMKTGISVLTNENHPTRSQMMNRNIYPDLQNPSSYERQNSSDKWNKTGENSRLYKTDDGNSMDWPLCKMRKGTPNEIFRAEFQELVNGKYNTRIYTDGSKKEEKVGYAVVTDH